MSTLVVDVEFHATVQDPSEGGAFDAFLDAVMDQLAALGRDVDLTAGLAAYQASFSIATPDQSTDSVIEALIALRTALHAAGCQTAGWPETHEIIGTRQVELADA